MTRAATCTRRSTFVAANGDGVDKLVPPIVLLAVLVASYLLRPADRRPPDANA